MYEIAGDSENRGHFNTLSVRPPYRISLRLGPIEDLFPQAPDSPEGRAARLQVLGLFYFPMRHKHAPKALEIAWDWVKEKIFRVDSDADADKKIQEALLHRIVGGAKGSWAEGGGLPIPVEHPDEAGEANFAKIRVPGGYTFRSAPEDKASDPLDDPRYPLLFGEGPYQPEEFFYRDNQVLGKIPLVATVERNRGSWEPAPDVAVYFQSQPPYALPAWDDSRSSSEQFGPPPIAEGIAKVLGEEGKRPEKPNDPQSGNCPKDRGGKRGAAAAGSIFSLDAVAGFHRPHEDGRPLSHAPYHRAEALSGFGGRHEHAVRVMSNRDGEAGVLFLPSRMGGDRYRLRAYLGPPTRESDGNDEGAIRVETGTFVVWRNIRISRHLRKDAAATVHPKLVEEVKQYEIPDEATYLKRVTISDEGGTFLGLPDLDAGLLRQKFARGFCEVEFDSDDPAPEAIDDLEYMRAHRQALLAGEEGMKRLDRKYDLAELFYSDLEAKHPNTLVHLPMRSARSYNARFESGDLRQIDLTSSTEFANIGGLVWGYMLPAFLSFISRDGCLPGLTILQGAGSTTWSFIGLIMDVSGYAFGRRGCFVWYGRGEYDNVGVGPGCTPLDYTSVFAHEIGHCLFREHAPGKDAIPGSDPVAFTDDAPECRPPKHDPVEQSDGGTVCLMSYKNGPGEFCASCLLRLRGWNVPPRPEPPKAVQGFQPPPGRFEPPKRFAPPPKPKGFQPPPWALKSK